MNKFEVNIEEFEGPLDLMLHLIKTNKLDLFDLDMNVLTTQYMHYISDLKANNVEIASEFLSELASLIEYKSKKMLPKETVEINEEYQDEEKERLVQRLIEYQNYKEASLKLEEAYLLRQEMHSKDISAETQSWLQDQNEIITGSPYALMKAMKKIIKRNSMLKPDVGVFGVKEVSLEERTVQIKKFLQKYQETTFEQVCGDCTNLHMIVVSFLVILDMVKNQEISVQVWDDNIYITRNKL